MNKQKMENNIHSTQNLQEFFSGGEKMLQDTIYWVCTTLVQPCIHRNIFSTVTEKKSVVITYLFCLKYLLGLRGSHTQSFAASVMEVQLPMMFARNHIRVWFLAKGSVVQNLKITNAHIMEIWQQDQE